MKRLILLLLALFIASCNKKDTGDSLASVGDSFLTEEAVFQEVGSGSGSASDIVNQWVGEEILFQNARLSGFINEPPYLSDLEKRLTGQLFLQRVAGEKIIVSGSEINDYYRKNKSGFIRKNKGARIYHLFFQSKEEGKSAANILKSNKNDDKKISFLMSIMQDQLL